MRRSLFLLEALALAIVAPAAAQESPNEPARTGPARGTEPTDARGSGAVPRGGAGAVVTPAKESESTGGTKVVMPVLKHFEHAAYPEAALKAGLEADVVLELTISATGIVTDARVVEPVGHGFDEAARDAARRFTFEPARRGTDPVAVKILYRYSFTLTPATAPSKEPVAPRYGALSGRLRIAGSDAPLAGVELVVTGAGSTYRQTTDNEGAFKLENLPPGAYSVEVTLPGYWAARHAETVIAGDLTEVTYRLAPRGEGIEVIVESERPPREVTRRTIERREIERIPGTSGDALRSIQSLPGVARPPGLAGLLIVRGSAPQDTQTFIDATNVPIIYHFGGLSSVVPTEFLERIDFYPGNFSARYGRVQGGIVDVALAPPNTKCSGDYGAKTEKSGCYHGMAQLDLIDARLMFQGPLGIVDGWDIAIGGRRSWVDTWLKPVLDAAEAGVTSAPVYYDYQLIAETRPTDRSRVSLRFYGSDDRLEILIRNPAAQDPAFGGNLTFGTRFYRVQALYEGQLSEDVELRAMVSSGYDGLDFSLGTFRFDLNAYPITTRSEFVWGLGSGIKLNTGMDLLVAPFEVYVRAPPPPRPGEPDPGPFATRPALETLVDSTVFRPGWYGELELVPTERLRIVPGARLDYARDTGHADFSPRLTARYDLVASSTSDQSDQGAGKSRLRTTAKGGVGLFHQPPQFQETDEVFGTPGLFSNRALHYSLGFEQELSRHVELSVEGFYKDLTEQVARSPTANTYAYNNDGLGTAYGIETLLKYKPDERFFGWLAYTLSKSVRQDGADAEEIAFQFDQTHNLIVLGSYRLGRGWEFGARFRVVSGPLTTPVLTPPSLPAVFAADAGAYAVLQGAPFSRRLPLFHQLDMRVDKRWQFRTWRLSAYLDVQNVYNNAAAEALVYNYNFSQEQFQTGLPIIPSLGVRGEF